MADGPAYFILRDEDGTETQWPSSMSLNEARARRRAQLGEHVSQGGLEDVYYRSGAGLANLNSSITGGLAALGVPGAQGLTDNLENESNRFIDQLSPAAQRRRDTGEGNFFLRAGDSLVESVPSTISNALIAAVAALGTDGASLAPSVLSRLMSVGEGVESGGGTHQGAVDQFRDYVANNPEAFINSPQGQRALQRHNGDMTRAVDEVAHNRAGVLSVLSGAAVGMVGAKSDAIAEGLSRFLPQGVREAGPEWLRTVLGSIIKEGPIEEGIQNPIEQATQNAIARGYDPTQDLMEGVPDSALMGAAVGSVGGAGFGALEARHNHRVRGQISAAQRVQDALNSYPEFFSSNGEELPGGEVNDQDQGQADRQGHQQPQQEQEAVIGDQEHPLQQAINLRNLAEEHEDDGRRDQAIAHADEEIASQLKAHGAPDEEIADAYRNGELQDYAEDYYHRVIGAAPKEPANGAAPGDAAKPQSSTTQAPETASPAPRTPDVAKPAGNSKPSSERMQVLQSALEDYQKATKAFEDAPDEDDSAANDYVDAAQRLHTTLSTFGYQGKFGAVEDFDKAANAAQNILAESQKKPLSEEKPAAKKPVSTVLPQGNETGSEQPPSAQENTARSLPKPQIPDMDIKVAQQMGADLNALYDEDTEDGGEKFQQAAQALPVEQLQAAQKALAPQADAAGRVQTSPEYQAIGEALKSAKAGPRISEPAPAETRQTPISTDAPTPEPTPQNPKLETPAPQVNFRQSLEQAMKQEAGDKTYNPAHGSALRRAINDVRRANGKSLLPRAGQSRAELQEEARKTLDEAGDKTHEPSSKKEEPKAKEPRRAETPVSPVPPQSVPPTPSAKAEGGSSGKAEKPSKQERLDRRDLNKAAEPHDANDHVAAKALAIMNAHVEHGATRAAEMMSALTDISERSAVSKMLSSYFTTDEWREIAGVMRAAKDQSLKMAGQSTSDPVTSPTFRRQVQKVQEEIDGHDELGAGDAGARGTEAPNISELAKGRGRADRSGGAGPLQETGISRRPQGEERSDQALSRRIQKILPVSGIRIEKNSAGLGDYEVSLDTPIVLDAAGKAAISPEGQGTPTRVRFRLDEKQKSISIAWSGVQPALRGSGVGTWLYRQLIDWGLSRGYKVFSDYYVSARARRVYKSLEGAGYEVIRLSGAREGEDGSLSTRDGRPAMQIKSTAEVEALDAAPEPRGGYQIGGPTISERMEGDRSLKMAQEPAWKKLIGTHPWINSLSRAQLVLMADQRDKSGVVSSLVSQARNNRYGKSAKLPDHIIERARALYMRENVSKDTQARRQLYGRLTQIGLSRLAQADALRRDPSIPDGMRKQAERNYKKMYAAAVRMITTELSVAQRNRLFNEGGWAQQMLEAGSLNADTYQDLANAVAVNLYRPAEKDHYRGRDHGPAPLYGDEWHRKKSALAKAMAIQLKEVGLTDVRSRVLDSLGDDVGASYFARLISVSMAGGTDTNGISLAHMPTEKAMKAMTFRLNHEMIHAMRHLGLFEPAEWKLMTNFAREYGVRDGKIVPAVNYPSFYEMVKSNPAYQEQLQHLSAPQRLAILNEEAIAMAAQHFRKLAPGKPKTLIGRIMAFLRALHRSMRSAKITEPDLLYRNFADIMDHVAGGVIGDRYRNLLLGQQSGAAIMDGNPVYNLVGVNARDTDIQAVQEAEEMERTGVLDEEAIWDATGLTRGPDGLWRREILTDNMRIKLERLEPPTYTPIFTLGSAVHYPELFNSYPQMRDIKLDIAHAPGMWKGHWDENKRTIYVRAKNMADARSVLLHEIQHAIQSIEGFAAGASPDDKMMLVTYQAEVEKYIERHLRDSRHYWDMMYDFAKKNGFVGDIRAYVRMRDQSGILFQLYKNHAGEEEARHVQERAKMPPNYRKLERPFKFTDIDHNDRIIVRVPSHEAFSREEFFDPAKDLRELDEFLGSPARNRYVQMGQYEVYLRKSKRILPNEKGLSNMLDLASISRADGGVGQTGEKGNFNSLLSTLEQAAIQRGMRGVYVENVFSPELLANLPKQGYLTEGSDPPSFYKTFGQQALMMAAQPASVFFNGTANMAGSQMLGQPTRAEIEFILDNVGDRTPKQFSKRAAIAISNRLVKTGHDIAAGSAKSPTAPGSVKEWTGNAIRTLGNTLYTLSNLQGQPFYLYIRARAMGVIHQFREVADSLSALRDKMSQADLEQFHHYMTTRGADPQAIGNPDVRSAAVSAKELLKKFGEENVVLGRLDQRQFAKYRERYLPRLYFRHIQKQFQNVGVKMGSQGYRRERLKGRDRQIFGAIDLIHDTARVEQMRRDFSIILNAASQDQQDKAYLYLAGQLKTLRAITDPDLRRELPAVKKEMLALEQRIEDADIISHKPAFPKAPRQKAGSGLISAKAYGPAQLKKRYGDNYVAKAFFRAAQANLSIGGVLESSAVDGLIEDPIMLSSFAIAEQGRDLGIYHAQNILASFDAVAKQIDPNWQDLNWVMPNQLVEYNGRQIRRDQLADILKEARRNNLLLKDGTLLKQVSNEEIQKLEALANANPIITNAQIAAHSVKMGADYMRVPDQPQYGPLAGMIVHRGIYNDIKGTFARATPFGEGKGIGRFGQAWAQLTSFYKTMMTSMNLRGHSRAIFQNVANLYYSGVGGHDLGVIGAAGLPVGPAHNIQTWLKVIKAGRIMYDHYHGKPSKLFTEATEDGVHAGTFSGIELRHLDSLIQHATAMNVAQQGATATAALSEMKQFYAWLTSTTGDFYNLYDVLGRFTKYMDEREKGAKRGDAMIEAFEWQPDYSLLPAWARAMRETFIPFLTINYKLAPKFIDNIMKMGGQIKRGEVAKAADTALRFTYAISMMSGAMAMLAAMMMGMDDDERKSLMESLPDYMRDNVGMIPSGVDSHSNITMRDTSWQNPWSMWLNAARAGFDGNISAMAREIGIGAPILDLIAAHNTGIDPFTGRKIFDIQDDDDWTKFTATFGYWINQNTSPSMRGVFDPFTSLITGKPAQFGSGDIARTLDKAFGDGLTQSGQPIEDPWWLFNRWLGENAYSYDPDQQATMQTQHSLAVIREHNQDATRRIMTLNRQASRAPGSAADRRRDIEQVRNEMRDDTQRRSEQIRDRAASAASIRQWLARKRAEARQE